MGIYPEPFWELGWGEFNLYIDGWNKNRDDEWRHTREVLAAIFSSAKMQMAQQGGKKSFQLVKGKDIIPLSGDIISKKLLDTSEGLKRFKESCKRLGIPLKRVVKNKKNG